MRISYLLSGFGHTGGSIVLYKFMDKLCERGYEVFAITPSERIRWRQNFSNEITKNLYAPKKGFSKTDYFKNSLFYKSAKKIILRDPILRKIVYSLIKRPLQEPVQQIQSLIKGLIKNWIESEITISTFCTTAYAAYLLMDRTIPLYHMQAYEELFFEDEVMQKLARLTYYLPLILLSNSSWLKEQITKRQGRNSYLINPGIDNSVFYPRVNLEEKYRHPTKFTIVSYYSPARLKGWNDAIKAMEIVFKKYGDEKIKWVVFGGRPSCKPDLPINFVGRVFGDSLACLYSNAYIVFMNSWYESFPLPPIEAMASGTAVVTTQIGTEDYAYDGKNAIVIPPKKPEVLAEAIVKLIEDPPFAYSLALKGVETARKFTWDVAADRLEEIINISVKIYQRDKFADIPKFISGVFANEEEAN